MDKLTDMVKPTTGRYTIDPVKGIQRQRLESEISILGDLPTFKPKKTPVRKVNSSGGIHRKISVEQAVRKISQQVNRKISEVGPEPLIITPHPPERKPSGFVNENLEYQSDDEKPPTYTANEAKVTIPDGKFPEEDHLPDSFDSAEDILVLLENPGRFQLVQFILMCLMYFTLSFNDLMSIFYGLKPDTTTCLNPTYGAPNNTDFLEREGTDVDFCQCAPGGVNYTYGFPRAWSIIADMGLVCDREKLLYIPTTLYFIGCLISGPTSGTIADKYGRRVALLIANIVYTVASFGLIFSRDIISFSILRFIIGCGRQGIQSVSFVLMLEWMSPWRRGPGCALAVFSVTLGGLMLALLAYLIQNWWYIQIVLTFANIWYIGLIWFAPESLKWLLLNNRPEQAAQIVKTVGMFNGAIIPEGVYTRITEIALNLQIRKRNGKPYSPGDWFKQSAIRRFSIFSCIIWFAGFFVYLTYKGYTPDFTSSPYSNLAIAMGLELFAMLIAIVISCLCGNRRPLVAYFTIGGALALLASLIPGGTAAELVAIGVFVVLGRMAIAMCSTVQSVYVQELFPTIVRNSAFGLCSLSFRLGDITGTYLPLLKTVQTCERDGASTLHLPLEIMGIVALIGAVATFQLPETRGKKMPETIQGTELRDEQTQELGARYEEDVKKIK